MRFSAFPAKEIVYLILHHTQKTRKSKIQPAAENRGRGEKNRAARKRGRRGQPVHAQPTVRSTLAKVRLSPVEMERRTHFSQQAS